MLLRSLSHLINLPPFLLESWMKPVREGRRRHEKGFFNTLLVFIYFNSLIPPIHKCFQGTQNTKQYFLHRGPVWEDVSFKMRVWSRAREPWGESRSLFWNQFSVRVFTHWWVPEIRIQTKRSMGSGQVLLLLPTQHGLLPAIFTTLMNAGIWEHRSHHFNNIYVHISKGRSGAAG